MHSYPKLQPNLTLLRIREVTVIVSPTPPLWFDSSENICFEGSVPTTTSHRLLHHNILRITSTGHADRGVCVPIDELTAQVTIQVTGIQDISLSCTLRILFFLIKRSGYDLEHVQCSSDAVFQARGYTKRVRRALTQVTPYVYLCTRLTYTVSLGVLLTEGVWCGSVAAHHVQNGLNATVTQKLS